MNTLSFFVQLRAVDDDVNDERGYVRYAIAESNVSGLVDIDELSGDLRLVSELDFETHPGVRLLVTASDEGSFPYALTSTATVLLSVTDVNDHEPRVSAPNCKKDAVVSEDAAVGTVLPCKFFVSDADPGANGLVRCRLDGPTAAAFELVPTYAPSALQSASGESTSRVAHYTARTRARLDREAMHEPQLIIVCTDSPTDPFTARTSTLALPLRIEDVNDCTPVITGLALPNGRSHTAADTGLLNGDAFGSGHRTELQVSFPENESPNTTIARIDASDCDAGM